MAEVSIGSALAKLEAGTQDARSKGLEDLKRILEGIQTAPKDDVNSDDSSQDDAFHTIFEQLYRIVSKEKPAFIRATKSTTKNNASSRLQVAAAALRLVVQVGAPRIRFKTAISVWDHIVDTLPTADGTLCEPLKNDYLKSFRILLSHAPHGEHMRHKQWQSYVDFALGSLSCGLDSSPVANSFTSSRDTSLASRNGQHLSVRLSQRSGGGVGKEVASYNDDIIAALKHLTAVPNAPIMSRAPAIVETIQDFLNVAARAQEEAFETLNNIIFVSLTEDVVFTQTLVSGLIPIMRRLWSTRSIILREQMLTALFTCRFLFLAENDTWPSIESTKLGLLLNTILSEYRTRNERDLLHFDNMQPVAPTGSNPLQLTHFKPIRSSAKALSCWMTLSTIACLVLGLSRQTHSINPTNPAEESPRKRQKIQTPLEELLQLAVEGTGQEKLVALQIVLFIFDQPQTTQAAWPQGLLRLLPDLGQEDTAIQTWVYLVLARLSLCDTVGIQRSPEDWLQVWEAARRAISIPASVRSACHTLDVLLQTGILKSAMSETLIENTLFGGGNNGPSSLTDTSLMLFTTVLRSNVFEHERRYEEFCMKILSWLAARWILPPNLDRFHNAHIAFHSKPEHLYHLLSSVCGLFDPAVSCEDWSPAHPLWGASILASTNLDFLRYLLSLPPRKARPKVITKHSTRQLDAASLTRLKKAITDLLTGRLKDFLQSWSTIHAERNSNVGTDIVEIVAVASLVSSAIWIRGTRPVADSKPPSVLTESRVVFTKFVLDQRNEYSREMATRVCDCILTLHRQLYESDADLRDEEYLSMIGCGLRLARHGIAPITTNDPSDLEFFDSDVWDSQNTQRSHTVADSTVTRRDLPICPDVVSLLAKFTVELTTASQIAKSSRVLDPASATEIVNEILVLASDSLIAARGAVKAFLNLKSGITRDSAHRLLKALAEKYLGEEAFERCEVALCFCLEAMKSLVELWASDDEDDDLAGVAFDVYEWFLNAALGKGIASPRVLSMLADLLDALLRMNASYGGEDLASPRTSLLKILHVSDAANKHRLADKLSQIFEKYILTQHTAVFDDIVDNLPSDPDNKEGIAVRLYIVAHLGARWHTVLRQATYHLFETVANVPAITTLARDCVFQMCRVLDLKRPRQLFNLFSPQIFYTWLSHENLSHMPFRPFGYTSLKEMALDNVGELTAQIALRGSSHAEELAQLLGQDWKSLLTQEFAHAEAYALSSEISLPKLDRLFDGSEKLIRKQLGSERYLELLRSSLPDIIPQLVISLQDDRGFDKALEKHQKATALSTWKEMYNYSGQDAQLPFAQQPSFRARCLLDELDYLYTRLDLQEGDVWTPSLLIHVYRQLLDKARPALGSLHICSIVRKIRVVISIAGPVALEGYPLEMMLHNLRPFLTVFDCAEDTMGIYRFLLRNGVTHIASRPSFIAGLGVAIFASLTGFILSSQDSTTQEGHFLATMTLAQQFRSFLGQYLESLNPTNSKDEALKTFKRIVQHAKAITQPGTSSISTNEGNLLYALLMDRSSHDPLLNELHFDLSVEILCRDFTISPDFQDDILCSDGNAAQFSPILRTLLKKLRCNESFRVWASQGIGRGYIVRGLTFNITGRTKKGSSAISSGERNLEAVSSYTSILRYLTDMLWKSEFPASTFAEKTLQLISSALQEANEDSIMDSTIDKSFMNQLRFKDFPCPVVPLSSSLSLDLIPEEINGANQQSSWAANILTQISEAVSGDPVLGFLHSFIIAIPEAADSLLPFAIHLVLLSEINAKQTFREILSQLLTEVLRPETKSTDHARQLVLTILLYLRRCHLPGEANLAQRNTWLEVDFSEAAIAASDCQMWHEALLFLELHRSQAQLQTGRSSRRSFVMNSDVPSAIVSQIYENVDDLDFFYGKHEEFDLQSVVSKMSHEGASQKSLSFQSAILDAQLRMSEQEKALSEAARSTASSLSAANMQGISEAVKQYYQGIYKVSATNKGPTVGQWDLLPERDASATSTGLVSLFRSMHSISNKDSLAHEVDQSLLELGDLMRAEIVDKTYARTLLSNLAVLAEARQIIRATTADSLDSTCAAIISRNEKMKLAEFERLSPILVGREAAFAAIRRNKYLRSTFSLNVQQALLYEVRVTRQSLDIASNYNASQFCLNRAMYLSELNKLAREVGLKVDIAIQYDLARTLWAQEETSSSIGILQNLKARDDTTMQAITVTRADILTDLGHKVAEARLEKPDEIIESYLLPAFKELHGRGTGSDACRVFHNFAAFCDTQLQDSDNLDDFTRISKIRDRKLREVHDLDKMLRESKDEKHRNQLKSALNKANTWFKLDEEEWKRVSQNRQKLILQCLENYLLSMRASDDYPNDTLRFLALWLNQAESQSANASVRKYLSSVPTLKFAPLVNQLTSRLLDVRDDFQHLLMDLMFRVCSDHPYHSLYQVFATTKSKGAKADEVAVSRNAAANKLADLVAKKSTSSATWVAIHNTSIAQVRMAQERLSDKDLKTGSKIFLRKLPSGQKLEQVMTESHTKIPPPTMKIALRPDRDYSKVPSFSKFDPEISIAGGVSAPKIATMIASDGSRHKMLLKGGNDDLRQDAIMEQVFEQVSNLLRDHRATRQRNLGIRTYKVIPLTTNAGIIEFVKDTIPLHDYLLPAHTQYFPKDFKPNRCRKEIADAQTKSVDQRVKAYKTVAANFHPVMRFFFMDHFLDPDDWFYKRLNYSRSTAAVSILGHVLGLGDRHGHNILLDENSGEVVHIDLGVAFEAGRVLPVPEVVPFRLTRDLVDGMGQTGVEGVFRRCCNFTLEALRRDQEAIMTILDVLRYDPLYSWSVSPLRLQKMQENNEQAEAAAAAAAGGVAGRREVSEPSEADRALTVVAKKLGKSLSVEATVNELIRQATDERNLAVLYCGWAAYA